MGARPGADWRPSRPIVRSLLDLFTSIPNSFQTQIDVTKDNVDWAKAEKRIFLKQNLETRLVGL